MKHFFLKSIFIFIDMSFLVVIFYITLYMRDAMDSFYIPEFNTIVLQDFLFFILIIVSLFHLEKLYAMKYDFWQDSLKIIKSFTLSYFIVLAMLTILQTNLEYSRLFISLYFVLGVLLMPIFRRYTKNFIYSFNIFKTRTLIVGTDEEVALFKKEIEENWYLGQRYVEKNYENVIIISKGLPTNKLNNYISTYIQKTSELFVVPYITDINFAHSNIIEYSNIRYNTIQIQNKLLLPKNIWIKESFDFIVVIGLSPAFLILHIILALLIKLDSKGAVFFKQHRLGRDDNDFICYKYRTMHEDSEHLLQEYLKNNPSEIEYYEKYHKYQNDPRITKIGKFLRASSLDEFAQVINIFKGEMSLVGPRPYMLQEACKLGGNQEFILKVKPGITGLWQVSGRNNLTFKERNELEVWYIKNWSLWADSIILIKTIKVVLGKVGAR